MERRNLAQISPKFAALQEALAKANTPEEKVEILLTLRPEEERDQEREKLLAKVKWENEKS